MITRPTVLILGAGASIPYGFPSGPQLIDYILADIPDSASVNPAHTGPRRNNIFELLGSIHEKDEVVHFRRALARSGKMSIDAFLESNPSSIREVGKSAIAAEILAAEEAIKTIQRNTEDWYRYFYTNVLACSLDRLIYNKLTIITYNYDRSLEYFLTQSFAADCSTTWARSAETVRQLPIYCRNGSPASHISSTWFARIPPAIFEFRG
jgi:hypothetical protein